MNSEGLDPAARWARAWLFEAALPIWWDVGADRVGGGYFDKIDQQGRPVDAPKRARVQARQAFVYAEAGKRGWDGPWRQAVSHGVDFLFSAYLRDDGLVRKTVNVDGSPADDGYDLYDQAFALFALAAAYDALGRPAEIKAKAEALLRLLRDMLGHPLAGFEEAVPRRLPLRSNPHMHLLEALLAWIEAGGGTPFEAVARDIVRLARERLIDPETGAIGEYYDGDWRFMPGEQGGVREPGHQFEWAYLLGRAASILGGDHAEASRRLEAFGARHGVDPARHVAVFALDAAGRVTDPDARLWAQTERLRTSLVLAEQAKDGEAERLDSNAADAFAALRQFLDVPVRGLWLDRMGADGSRVDEPAPASSFYHILTGIMPLIDRAAPAAAEPLIRRSAR